MSDFFGSKRLFQSAIYFGIIINFICMLSHFYNKIQIRSQLILMLYYQKPKRYLEYEKLILQQALESKETQNYLFQNIKIKDTTSIDRMHDQNVNRSSSSAFSGSDQKIFNQNSFQSEEQDDSRSCKHYKKSKVQYKESQAFQKGFSNDQEVKKRKIRTTITSEKLEEMNLIFSEYSKLKGPQKDKKNNLKAIGDRLGLGYSTILHKYREYSATNKVKGGALISSKKQKRKYKKTQNIQSLIRSALKEQSFYTAVELSQYIENKYGMKLSRSIISRHLGQMGYSYKNINHKKQNEKNFESIMDVRKSYASLLNQKISTQAQCIYIGQFDVHLADVPRKELWKKLNYTHKENQNQTLHVILSIHDSGIMNFRIHEQSVTHNDFEAYLNELVKSQKFMASRNVTKDTAFIFDLSEIHRRVENQQRIFTFLSTNNIEILYLPPYSNKLNPIILWHNKLIALLKKKSYYDFNDLEMEVKRIMQEVQTDQFQEIFSQVGTWLIKATSYEKF